MYLTTNSWLESATELAKTGADVYESYTKSKQKPPAPKVVEKTSYMPALVVGGLVIAAILVLK